VGLVLPCWPLVAVDADFPSLAAGQPEREPARKGGVLHARHARNALLDLAVEYLAGLLGVAVHADPHSANQHVVGIEAEIYLGGLPESLDAEAGSDQQDQGDCDLCDDKTTPKPVLGRASLGRAPALLERRLQVDARRLEGWQ